MRDNIYSSSTSTLVATGGVVLRGSNNIQGQSNKKLGLEGDIYSYSNTELNHVIFTGNIRSQNYIDIDNSDVSGTLTTDYGYVKVNYSTGNIGDIFSHSGIWMDGAHVTGDITTRNNIVSLKNVSGGVGDIDSQSGVWAENSTIEGDITTRNNIVSLTNVSGGVGDVYALSGVLIENSDVEGSVTTQYQTIVIKDSRGGFGNLNAQNGIEVINTEINGNLVNTWGGIILRGTARITGDVTSYGNNHNGVIYVNDDASVDGICLYVTVPEHACDSGSFPEPIALYHFDESSWDGVSHEVTDSSGNDLHGVAINDATTGLASNYSALPSVDSLGTCGYGIFGRQKNQHVEIADNDLLDMNDSFTISAWVKPTRYPISGLHSILSKDNNYEFHLNSSGQIFWWWQDKKSNGDIKTRTLTSEASIPKDKWSFITIRYDSERNDNKSSASIFINGSESGEILINANRELVNNTKPLQIGQDQNFSGRAFDGAIDEVQIFDKRLTQSEIEKLMAQRHPCSDSPILQCFTDRFDNGDLSDLWVTSTSKGPFTPQVINNRLRFTEAQEDQSTASTYQRLFPAKDNLVEIEFDHYAYGGDGADGIAIVLSDATVTPAPGAFGGPLGYGFKSGEPGFAGGWLGIGIDEYGNYSNEGGSGSKPGRRRQSVALRGSGSGETGYQYLAGACEDGTNASNGECLDPSVDGSNDSNRANHRYKIVIDSRLNEQSNVEIFRKIGSGDWSSIVGPIDVLNNQYSQSAIPNDFLLSITGSTGNLTNIHEIDNLQVCALDSRPVGEQIDHFRLTHSGQELTCNAETVLIEACLDATCSSRYTDFVTAKLAPATLDDGGWVGGNVVTFSGGSASFDIRKEQIGNVILGVTGSSPTTKPFAKTLCNKAGSGFSASNCGLQFTSNGFELVVSDKIANLPTIATLKAGGSCGPGFSNESKNIAFWSTYESPTVSDIVGSPKVEISGTTIGNTESTAAPINVQFNANGEAQLQLDYPDAGKLQLNVKYTGQPGADDQGLVVEGDGEFVSFPQRLVVSAKNSANHSGACASANLNCSTFAKAGEQFDIEVTAMSGSNSTRGAIPTPNYSDSVGIEHLLVAPSGEDLGELVLYDSSDNPITNPDSVLLAPRETKAIPATISEVGVFSIKVTPPSTYLGSNYHTIPAALSANIGRFYPAYFSVVDSSLAPNLDAFCSSDNDPGLKFSYIGQNFTYEQVPELYLEAKSVEGALTNNYYHADWWRYSTPWLDRSYTDSNSRNIVFEGDGGTTSEFASGRVYLSDAELMRYEKSEPPLEPFNADFSLVLAASDLMDSDNVCVKTSDSGSLADCLSYSFSDIDEDMELRWGRLLIHDTYGPEVSPIRQRIEIQHFEKGRFETNVDDSCTDLTSINRFDFISDDYTVVASGVPNPPEVNASLQDTQVEKGESWIEFSAPGAGDTGLIDTEIDLNKHGVPWLIEDLDGEGIVSGIAQFGIYRGSDRVIWWTEKN
ncbi:DUF6701 domain-containing protein [Vibrio sp. nBUS_14]|uniref:DUF6701 domain-containing protein n=1 Tax=Vibrio sp. nBUS_14 TaxID=3395321 RepID=UPI003EBB044D